MIKETNFNQQIFPGILNNFPEDDIHYRQKFGLPCIFLKKTPLN